jgi:hypothetical protein
MKGHYSTSDADSGSTAGGLLPQSRGQAVPIPDAEKTTAEICIPLTTR